MKYARQRNESGCGPVALLNAMKWTFPNKNITYGNTYNKLSNNCLCTRAGTYVTDFIYALEQLKREKHLNFTTVKTYNNDRILKHIHNGGAMILGHFELPGYDTPDREFHYSFWNGDDGANSITGVNVVRRPESTVNIWSDTALNDIRIMTNSQEENSFEVYLIHNMEF